MTSARPTPSGGLDGESNGLTDRTTTGAAAVSLRRENNDVVTTAASTAAKMHASIHGAAAHARVRCRLGWSAAAEDIGWLARSLSRIHVSSRRRFRAVCHRCAGSFANDAVTRRSSAGGTSGCLTESGTGSRSRIAAANSAGESPANGRTPATISVQNRSEGEHIRRESTCCARSCSGAIYGNVPARIPSAVAGPGDDASGAAPCTGGRSLESPKSISLTPDFVIMMLPGFRSRWTIPTAWASARASAI